MRAYPRITRLLGCRPSGVRILHLELAALQTAIPIQWSGVTSRPYISSLNPSTKVHGTYHEVWTKKDLIQPAFSVQDAFEHCRCYLNCYASS